MLLSNSQIKEEKQLNKKTTATLLNDKKWIKKKMNEEQENIIASLDPQSFLVETKDSNTDAF